MARQFENTLNGHRKDVGATSIFGAILFGPIFFAVQGAWGWAVAEITVSLILYAALGPPATLLVIPFQMCVGAAAVPIVSARYLSRGWREVGTGLQNDGWGESNNKGLSVLFEPVGAPVQAIQPPPVEQSEKTCPQCAESVKSAAKICRFCRFEFSTNVDSAPT